MTMIATHRITTHYDTKVMDALAVTILILFTLFLFLNYGIPTIISSFDQTYPLISTQTNTAYQR